MPANNNKKLDRVYLEYNTDTTEFCIAVDGNVTGIALAIARAMRTSPEFAKAVCLATTIRGMP